MKRAGGRLTGTTAAITLAATLATALTTPFTGASTAGAPAPHLRDYLVFYADGAHAQALKAITGNGGTVLSTDPRLGYITAKAPTGPGARFVEDLAADAAIAGVSSDRRIGHATALPAAPARTGAFPDAKALLGQAGPEPLAGRQWDMKMIGATADGSHATAAGAPTVLVGVIDTGVDGKHPDIAPNFDATRSRNFVTDRPEDPNGAELDGPCEFPGCKDPADWDDDGHGTHVASTIASPANGLGIAGVAPRATIVNLRAGQDSGLFFLKPSLDALTYAADNGIDVVNMSYYVDPWLFNCKANPADSKAEQLEQRGVITGMQRALDYARAHGVTLISAIGNGSTDLGKPRTDTTSPDYPLETERPRTIDNSCLNVPAESKGVISVSATGPSKRKSYFSDYGIEQTDLAAPGGDEYDGPGDADITRTILAAAPEHVLRKEGLLTSTGDPKSPAVVRDCRNGRCAYYQYLAGTSMAAPHATGVAAILIGRFGEPSADGVTMPPAEVERLLYATATRKACPSPRAYAYRLGEDTDTHTCEGKKSRNGFYGRGIVNAAKAATIPR
ncbi:S8 family serine peptidase [Planomonospora sp. ID67723]|uniref:S8 family peptidase n=1 Tax=Planomonospora sp. ID67723 TaxID=2738134 RepID=UPI0018C3AEE2|nr:S8 family serine peptidase [Planomonospora sp. ID67723]MBG0829590.1 S8 family serine peptidase [Planomonospora sp. ID67723]